MSALHYQDAVPEMAVSDESLREFASRLSFELADEGFLTAPIKTHRLVKIIKKCVTPNPQFLQDVSRPGRIIVRFASLNCFDVRVVGMDYGGRVRQGSVVWDATRCTEPSGNNADPYEATQSDTKRRPQYNKEVRDE